MFWNTKFNNWIFSKAFDFLANDYIFMFIEANLATLIISERGYLVIL